MNHSSSLWSVSLLLLFAALATPANAQLQSEDFYFRVAGTGSFPVSPSEFSDPYSSGRGINAGVGIHINDAFRLQTEIEYTKWSRSSVESGGLPLRPDLTLSNFSASGGGDITRLAAGAGLRWLVSDGASFKTYLRGMGHLGSFTRQDFIQSGTARLDSPAELREESQLSTSFSIGLGFLFPLTYTTAIVIEPSYSATYLPTQTLQGFDVRAGVVLGEF